ncbi:G-protein-signaling modulator 1 [Hypsibius exemplaris]|uniref:G-protein-signaling modulator 1 n=1 Tax=Hypsibius exemplaris TaxID=2072580 RepID=A0A1W0WYR8_HYPEX|nr:G-protein-signaling modulator 1 [Hypsibius exemplaris]
MEDNDCLTLALQGEALCRSGDFRSGVDVFLKALAANTDDVAVLSAIYIQLGNAYFYLESYDKALDYHSKDIRIARQIGDENGEAKASGNIAMTLKCLGQYAEAIACGQRQLDIYRKLDDDRTAVSRALYNIGNIYLAKAKASIAASVDGDLSEESKEDLILGLEYYKENYLMVREFGDLAAQGRVCGNLGSVQYMLGNFPQAVMYHQERLLLARECKDIPAERRAYTNLGNCHVFLGQYPVAEQYYLKALALVDPARDRALEAQACYSLGNTYSLMGDHVRAVQFYQRHLAIAKELQDSVGQGRACWSLGSAHAALGQTAEAIQFAEEHLRISQELGDAHQCSYAEANLQEYTFRASETPVSAEEITERIKRISMEQMDLLKLTPDVRAKNAAAAVKYDPEGRRPSPAAEASTSSAAQPVLPPKPRPAAPQPTATASSSSSPRDEEEDMFDLISRCQSQRLDDQRCEFVSSDKENNNGHANGNTHHYGNGSSKTGTAHANVRTFEDLMDMIAGVQSKRLDEQRADLPSPSAPPATRESFSAAGRKSDSGEGDSLSEDFFDMLVKVQGSRMGDQRATLSAVSVNKAAAPTVPDEDFTNLLQTRRRVSSKGPADKT